MAANLRQKTSSSICWAIAGSAAARSSSYVTWAPSLGRMSSRLRLSSSARLAQSCPGRLINGVCEEANPPSIVAISARPFASRCADPTARAVGAVAFRATRRAVTWAAPLAQSGLRVGRLLDAIRGRGEEYLQAGLHTHIEPVGQC